MKFPGRRNTKHYFPVSDKGRISYDQELQRPGSVYIVGIDQLLVDIEIHVDDDFLKKNNIPKGQSVVLDDNFAEEVYKTFKERNLISGEFPGGSVGNTLHNFSILSDCMSVSLGTIKKQIEVGDYAYKYLCNTSSKVNLSYLQPCDKPMGRALCFVTEDGERTFGISRGCMNDFSVEYLPVDLIEKSSALLLTAYAFRDPNSPIAKSATKAAQIAKKARVPVVFTLGTSGLVKEKRDFLIHFIKDYVTVVAMNQSEAYELTHIEDPLLATESLLDLTDVVLLTVGSKGLYLGGVVDQSYARQTKEALHTKSIVEYNKFEYSRPMRRGDCKYPIKTYSHINPFMGGPQIIKNTNGAGDAALAALLHDMSANMYHKHKVPNSPKHGADFLTYSSLSQISKYANRVSYEVLTQNSPRLMRGLPEREDSLEEAYWAK